MFITTIHSIDSLEKLKRAKADAVIIGVGNIFDEADQAVKILGEEGYNIGLVNPRYIKPFDKEMILDLVGK